MIVPILVFSYTNYRAGMMNWRGGLKFLQHDASSNMMFSTSMYDGECAILYSTIDGSYNLVISLIL